jgi:type I restriction enzyme M protein
MTDAERAWYYNQIEKVDPQRKVVNVDRKANTVRYSDSVKSDENRVRSADAEEVARALALCMLTTKAYGYDPESFYIEKYYKHGRPGSMRDEVDLLILDGDGLPFAMWDFKSAEMYEKDAAKYIESQLFGTAPLVGAPKFLVYATVRPTGKAPALTVTCIDRTQHQSFASWDKDGQPHVNAFPAHYADPKHKPFVRGGTPDLRTDCTQADFRAAATTFHEEFFGEHPDTVLFTNLMKCLLAKIYDEKQAKTGKEYKFQVLYKKGREQSAADVFKSINELYGEAYRRYIDASGDDDKIDAKEFPPERVKTVVSVLQGMSITKGASLNSDVIGAFFEEILRAGFKQDKGMYFTHANLVYFMTAALDIDGLTVEKWKKATHPENRLPYVIDPACGSGAFLLRAMNVITDAVRKRRAELVDDEDSIQFFDARMSDANPNYWAENFLYGIDPKFVMAITAKINLVLHGDGSTHVFKHDGLKPLSTFNDSKLKPLGDPNRSVGKAKYPCDVVESFDVVLSNPPFGVTLAKETKAKLGTVFTLRESLPSEAHFLERWYQLLRPGGRLGVVVPESLLNSPDNADARLFLYRMFYVRAIVALPRNLFIDTPTLTSLLFAQKKSGGEVAAWDAAWEDAEAQATSVVDECKAFLRSAKKEGKLTPGKLESEVLALLADLLPSNLRIVRRGSTPLSATLPLDVSDLRGACGYYEDLFKVAAFRTLVRNVVFRRVVSELDYEFPVYMVDEVGYKLSKRKERERPNQLCLFIGERTGAERPNLHRNGESVRLVVDQDNPERILDYITRDVKWA